jgi:hypothetical protein
MIKKKKWERKYYNRGTKDLPPLKKGDIVQVHPLPRDKQKRWFKARVERKVDIRSYKSYTQKRDNSTDETKDTCEQQQNISMVQFWGKTTGRTMPHQQRTRSRGKGNQHPQEQKARDTR